MAPATTDAEAAAALFGGAQYYRLMREFRAAVSQLPQSMPSDEEVMNAMGLSASNQHGSMYTGRSASSIALQRNVEALRPLLTLLFARIEYVMTRLLLHVKSTAFTAPTAAAAAATAAALTDDDTSTVALPPPAPLSAFELVMGDRMWEALEAGYKEHLAACVRECLAACREELDQAPDRLALLGCGPLPARVRAQPRRHKAARQFQTAAVDFAPALASRGRSTGDGIGAALVAVSVDEWRARVAQAITRKVHSHVILQFLESLPSALSSHLEVRQRPPGVPPLGPHTHLCRV